MYEIRVNLKTLHSIYERLCRSFSINIGVIFSILIVMSFGPVIIYAMSAISNEKSDAASLADAKALWSAYSIIIYLILPIVIVYKSVKRQWLACSFLLAPILYYIYVLAPLKDYALDDRFLLVSKSHEANTNLYAEYMRGGGDGKQELIGFERKCKPPAGCDCWVMRGNEAMNWLWNITGEWQIPNERFTSAFEPLKAYHLVSVKPISRERTFSLIGCDVDWRLWWTH